MTLRTLCAGAALLALVSCSSGSPAASTPTTPTTPNTPAPPAAPVTTWSVAGRLVDTATRQAIPGAQLTPSWDLAAATTAADGTFQLGAVANPPTNPYKLTVSGSGLVSREVWVTWERGGRADVTIDVIRNTTPFSMDFYKQFVRGTFDTVNAAGAPWPVLRWNDSPKFYVKTVDQNGRAIEPEVVATVLEGIARAVPAYTGGTLTAAAIESGTDVRLSAAGWINVVILRDPNQRATCGFSFIGANPGTITLYNDVCACGSRKILGATVLHEVGHALGFFHVSDRNSLMFPFIPGDCPSGDPSPAERYHAGIAYARPRGNTEPDNDPSNSRFLTAGAGPWILADK